jgi:tRNA 2-selenouridine synthase
MDGGWRPLVYCWRGGQRSGSFASILSQIGWRVEVLEGGYRTWRRLVVGRLYDAELGLRLIRLDGYTGTAKTALLARGRGARRAGDRPRRAGAAPGLDPWRRGGRAARAEGLRDGARAGARRDWTRRAPCWWRPKARGSATLRLPPALWAAMKGSPRIVVEAPVEARAAVSRANTRISPPMSRR